MSEEFNLAEPEIIEDINFEVEYQSLKDDFISRSPNYTAFQDSDPIMMFLQTVAAIIVDMLFKINAAVKSTLILLASGLFLDHLAVFWDVKRKILVPANPNAVPPTAAVLESDEDFRARILLAIKAFTKGATKEYYKYYTLEADPLVESAEVYKEEVNTPYVDIAIRSTDNNGIPSPALLASLEEKLNDDSIRSISDIVRVRSAVGYGLDVEANITLLPDAPITALADIENYFTQQLNSINILGRDITRSWIISKLNTSDVYKVELISPTVDIIAQPYEFVALSSILLHEEVVREF
jgi:phage-related baseplate assembly protein